MLGEIYAQLTNLSTAYEVFFHGAMEIPDISKQHHSFPETDYTTVEFLALEILTSDEAKKYDDDEIIIGFKQMLREYNLINFQTLHFTKVSLCVINR